MPIKGLKIDCMTVGQDVILKSKGYTNGRQGCIIGIYPLKVYVLWLTDKNGNRLRWRGGVYSLVKPEKLTIVENDN